MLRSRLAPWLIACLVAAAGCAAPLAPLSEDDRSNLEDGSGDPKDPKKPPGAGDDDDDDDNGEPGEEPAMKSKKDGSALIVDLGPVGDGKTVTLDVPDTAIGFNVVVRSEGEGETGIQKIATPSGTVLLDDFTVKNGMGQQGLGADGAASVSIPQNDMPDAVSVPPGKWKITFAGKGTNARAKVRIQTTDDGKFHGGILDLHIHIPTGLKMSGTSRVVDAATAEDDSDFAERLDIFFDALEDKFGIGRGKVSFHKAAAKLTAIDGEDDPYVLGSVTKDSPVEQSMHLLLTNSLLNGEVLGISPGIPGAASTPGTGMSTIMAALYDDSDATTDGITWLHEMGHFVGLNHTSEFDGKMFDPLKDTAECRNRTESTVCPEDGNLMSTASIHEAIVTKGQQNVFRGSPIYRAFGAKERALPRPARARSRHSVTRSGRALRPSERWLAGTLCGSAHHAGLETFVASRGAVQAIAELEAMTNDADLPKIYRTKASRLLTQVKR